jgi:hypothetical protein
MKNYRKILASLFIAGTMIFPAIGNAGSNPSANVPAIVKASFESYAIQLYKELNEKDLSFNAFKAALKGYMALKDRQMLKNPDLLTIVDFSKSSTEKRLFIIDLKNKRTIHKSLVAHGQGSGDNYATEFSNDPNSHQSSLGFYITGETYDGKHGLSLKLDGLEKGINDNARERAIVIHGADYVSESFVRQQGRLGRSHGCPAVPSSTNADVIRMIKGKTCLFVYYPDQDYIKRSSLINSNVL